MLKLIVYITCKTKLVLFSTNSILALSRSVSELVEDIGSLTKSAERMWREKEQQEKIDKLKKF